MPGFRDWLQRHRPGLEALVFDVDGVLMVGARAVPGTAALLESLEALTLPYRILGNPLLEN